MTASTEGESTWCLVMAVRAAGDAVDQARTCLWLASRFQFGEGLGGLGEGVGDGSVPVHARATGPQFPRARSAEGSHDCCAACQNEPRRLDHVGFRGALDNRGSIGPGGCKCARDQMEDDGYPEALTAPSKGVNGTAAELERAVRSPMRSASPIAQTWSRTLS
jgi:hypothetical protein